MLNKYKELLKPISRNNINKLNILIISVFFFLISVINCYYYTTKNYLNVDIKTGISYKRLYVGLDRQESQDNTRKLLENIEHVVGVFSESSYFNGIHSKEFAQKKMDGTVEIYSATNNSLPNLVKGRDFPTQDGNYIICPKNFYPNGSETAIKELDYSSKIDIESYIGKDLNFVYPDLYKNQDYELKLKLIGIYENNNSNIDESTCYTTEKVLHEIFINQNKNDEYFDESLYQNYFIQVDEIENIEKVIEELQSLGFSYENVSTINYDYFENIFTNIKSISIILSVIIIMSIIAIKYKYNKENYEYYKLLSYIGYSTKRILVINFLSTILILITSFFTSLIFLCICKIGLSKYLEMNPFALNKWNIIYNFNAMYIIFLIFIIFSIIETICKIKKGQYDSI